MKKRISRQKSGKQVDRTQAIALLVIIISVIAIFMIIDNPRTLNLGTITGGVATEYKTPVGGTVTISYTFNTWNGREWVWGDLDTYQYNYDIINLDTGLIVARGTSWRVIHVMTDSITLRMNKEGTFRYRLQETVDFLKENRRANGTAKDFRIIVGTGINPTPTPTPTVGTGGTATVISEPIEEVTVITTPAPAVTFKAYDPGTPTQTPDAIRIEPPTISVTSPPISVITPVQGGSSVITPPISTDDDRDLTFVPAPESIPIPTTEKESSGFEAVFVIIAFCILIRRTK